MVDQTNPKDMSEEQLSIRYDKAWKNATGNFRIDAEASLLAIEINRRLVEANELKNSELAQENAELAYENTELAKKSHRLTMLSLGFSALAISFALTSAVFSYLDWAGDFDWQKNQIENLEKIHNSLVESNNTQNHFLEQLKRNNEKNSVENKLQNKKP